MLEVKNLSKSYGRGERELPVLKDINLGINKGEFLAIEGPSGAGKSTLLHILGGLDRPTQGEVVFEGRNVYAGGESERAAYRNRKVGFVFQFYHLLPELDVLENISLPGFLRSWWARKKAITYARELAARVGLSERLKHRPNELSGGEQQRVAICRALINKPRLLLCDEPTGNLDSENGENILALLQELNQREQLTLAMVTHDKDIARRAGRVVYLKDGILLKG